MKILERVAQSVTAAKFLVAARQVALLLGVILALGAASKHLPYEASEQFFPTASVRLLWQRNLAFSLAIDLGKGSMANRVFVAGNGLEAYDVRTGQRLWSAGISQIFYAVVEGQGRVFAAGGGPDILLQAYEGSDGTLDWEDRLSSAEGYDFIRIESVALGNGRVFAAGWGPRAGQDRDFIVRAYAAETGAILWEDRFHKGTQDFAYGISTDTQGMRVFAVGTAGSGTQDFVVRAYEARTGALIWQDDLESEGDDVAFSVTTGQGRVFVAGRRGDLWSGDFVVRAYNAKSGALIWQDEFDQAGFSDSALAIAEKEGKVFAVGQGFSGLGGVNNFVVRGYDSNTGELLWQDLSCPNDQNEIAYSITIEAGRLFVGGTSQDASGKNSVLLRAYNKSAGKLLWQDRYEEIGNSFGPFLASGSGRLFVARNLLRAYNVTGLKPKDDKDPRW